MFKRSHLEELAAFSSDHPVVSVYLNMAPHMRGKGSPDAYRARLKTLLKEVSERAPKTDIEAIETYFEKEFDWVGRSTVVFCGNGGDFWYTQRFAVPIRSSIHVGDRPFIVPLANLMDTYGSYVVALVDKQAVRLFYFHLGELVAWEKVGGEAVQRLKTGSGSAGQSGSRGDHLQSHTDERVRGNLRIFADAMVNFAKHHSAEHILIGGAEPTTEHFKSTLPQPWINRVEDLFSISMRASDNEVLEQSLKTMQKKEKARESDLVENVKATAAAGGTGVVGLDETLEAIEQGRVDTLVLVEGTLPPEEADTAVVKVVDFGGKVAFVDEDSPLAEFEGIGALLRY